MVFEIFNGKCDAMVDDDVTLNDLYAKGKVIHFGTNRFLIPHIRLPIGFQ